MNVLLFGATGMVGQGVLRECLLDPDVQQVRTVGRTPTGIQQPKLRETIHRDLWNYFGIEADLSGFGADLRQWTTLKKETVDKHVKFTVNGRIAYSLDFPNPPTDIVGVQYRFKGGGAVKGTRLTGPGKTIQLK